MALEESTFPFPDFIVKLDKFEKELPRSGTLEFWKQINEQTFICKITGKELSKIAFERYQLSKGGSINFIVEIL